MSDQPIISTHALWAKTDTGDRRRWLPLLTHSINVAAVATELFAIAAPARRDDWIAWFDGDKARATRFLAALAGWHDLGKASVVFQRASPEQVTRLSGLGIRLKPPSGKPLRHGTITAGTLPDILKAIWPDIHPKTLRRYAAVSGMHHGSRIKMGSLRNGTAGKTPGQVGTGPWEVARRELVDAVIDAVGGVAAPPPTLPQPHLALWAAGLISVADWIGSSTDFFPIEHPVLDPAQAGRLAPERAARALNDLGWTNGHVTVPDDFTEMFAHQGWDDPNPTQRATIHAVRAMEGPGLVVVEAPMGQGKTEAAFWVAAHAERHWGARGVYIAMPTRASSDQLFGRLEAHLTAHAADGERVNLLLLHGHAAISAHLAQVRRQVEPFDPHPAASTPGESGGAARDWFSARKRGLLAPYGVGTVDQTLLGVLETRHHFVRLHGLAGKTLVFDEVHAYDTFMDTIFTRELRALGALGAPVVLLSATLPSERRIALLHAYAEGAGWKPEASGGDTPYPRVSTVDRCRIASVGINDDTPDRTVALRWFIGSDEADQRERLVSALDQALTGNRGTCAVICNTVRQAQELFTALEETFPGEVDLLHARFRQMDRAARQERILTAFGKGHSGSRGEGRRIVVATQVIEQSLDLDFDLMVTAFCPTDLLLQRLGRLHRHRVNDGGRPTGLRSPQLWVFGVGGTDDPAWPSLGVPVATRFVYQPHALLRSWAVLRGRDDLTLPSDIGRLVEATYSLGAVPPDDLADDWHCSATDMAADDVRAALAAEDSLIPLFTRGDDTEMTDPIINNRPERTPEEEVQGDIALSAIARTRDGPPSVDVVLLTAEEAATLAPTPAGTPLHMDAVAGLLERSVSVSQRGPYHALMADDPPAAWRDDPWLERHRLLQLDDSGRAQAGKYTFDLHPKLGVTIDHAGSPEEE